jgi:hypothetical protein
MAEKTKPSTLPMVHLPREPRAADLALGTPRGDLQHIFLRYTNILFVFVAAGFAVQYTQQRGTIIFAINLIAVFPSSVLMGVGMKSMRLHYGGIVQAVLYMTFGCASCLALDLMFQC